MDTGFALSCGLILAVGLLCCVVCYLMLGVDIGRLFGLGVGGIYFNCGLVLLRFVFGFACCLLGLVVGVLLLVLWFVYWFGCLVVGCFVGLWVWFLGFIACGYWV